MLLGNAAAPRWWEQDPARFDQYLKFLVGAGATSIEFVLHRGAIDPRGGRVHVLENDWLPFARQAQSLGLACQLHASLDRRFDLSRWPNDRTGLQADYLPLLTAARQIAGGQAMPVAYVLHGTSSASDPNDDGDEGAKQFFDWAANELAGAGVVLCPELRPARDPSDRRWDRSRASLAKFVAELDHLGVGICWDLGHDWENRRLDADWSAIPDEAFLSRVRHVHLHGIGSDGALHQPLGAGGVPWAAQLRALADRGYGGAATLEIRYRYALAVGEPWTVLAASYRRALEAIRPL
jgi:sugar phosphate isomerase/epimerase